MDMIDGFTEEIPTIPPDKFVEDNRYLPAGISPMPGPFRFSINPYMREILNCCDVDSPVREINLMKGVQITYSTLLECILMYFAGHIKSAPMMYVSADKELAKNRIENNILPMFQQSDMAHIIQSTDIGNKRKSGKTKDYLQFLGGGSLFPFGAKNADKMRDRPVLLMLKDELDGWPLKVGRDGDPDKLTDDRCAGYSRQRKIFRGSTPGEKAVSKIWKAYQRGDRRKYHVVCRHCNHSQPIWWNPDKDTGKGGFTWETEHGVLIPDSVHWKCAKCDHPHSEQDKQRLYDPAEGAEWVPTARAVSPFIRSYLLPGMYSPIGMRPWFENVLQYLDCYDPIEERVTDIAAYQVFVNNVQARPFETRGAKITRAQVSPHKRDEYKLGTVPNRCAIKHTGDPILFLTCQVDIHKRFLAVAIMGWTRGPSHKPEGFRNFVVDYRYLRDDSEEGILDPDFKSPVWGQLEEIIEREEFITEDGEVFNIRMTLLDANYEQDLAVSFCAKYSGGVYPILGRARPAKAQRIREFDEWSTQLGTLGYKIVVDHYKDRIAPVLRREWGPEDGPQGAYHFNTAGDTTDKMLDELTKETRVMEENDNGEVKYVWKRPSGARNELWDLLVYGHAAVEILAWSICIEEYELECIDWAAFWDHIEAGG
jgi:phage terminase large subunit GpA-like protein